MTEQATEVSPPAESTVPRDQIEIDLYGPSPYLQITDYAFRHGRKIHPPTHDGREVSDGVLNLDNLSWREGDLYSKVARHAFIYRDQFVIRRHNTPIFHPQPIIGWGFYGKIKDIRPAANSIMREFRVVKTWNTDRDLISMEELSDPELQQRFHRASLRKDIEPEKRVHDVRLSDLAPEPQPSDYETIPIQLDGTNYKDGDGNPDTFVTLEKIDQQRLQHGLPNWVGFTWSVHHGRYQSTCRIVEDEVLITLDEFGNRKPPQRTWIVETEQLELLKTERPEEERDMLKRGVEVASKNWERLNAEELQERLKDLPKRVQHLERGQSPPPEAQPRFVVLKPSIESGTVAEMPGNYELSINEAVTLLSYRDLKKVSNQTTASIEQLADNPVVRQYATVLQQIVRDVGIKKVMEFAGRYADDIRRLGPSQTDEKGRSISVALWQLIQYGESGGRPAELFANNNTARETQRQIIDFCVGQAFMNVALQQKQRPEIGEPREVNGKIEQTQTLKTYSQINLDVTNMLAPFIKTKIKMSDKDAKTWQWKKDRVIDMLAVVARGEKETFSRADCEQIGRYLRMSVGS